MPLLEQRSWHRFCSVTTMETMAIRLWEEMKMARRASLRSVSLLACILTVAPGRSLAQAPCTDEQAREKHGHLTLDHQEQDELDRRTRVKPDPVVLKKIDQAIALLKQALPDFAGATGTYSHRIYDPNPNSHVLHFSVQVGLFTYYCPPLDYAPGKKGKINVEGETGTWITIDFNSLGWLVEEASSLGKEMSTPDGRAIFELPKEGEFKGRRLFLPDKYGTITQVILITAPNHFPFKPVTREEFLQARESVQQHYLDEARAKVGPNSPAAKEREGQLEEIRKLHASMTPAELRSQAVVREWSASPSRRSLFVTEAERGLRLVSVDRNYIDRTLPRSAVQLITLHWRNNDQDPAKKAAMRQFEDNFDLDALSRLMDR